MDEVSVATKSGVEVLQSGLERVRDLRDKERHSLRLWRWIFYVIGLAAVVSATLAGAASLGDLLGSTWVGVLALAAAVLTAVDKYLTAIDHVSRSLTRYDALQSLSEHIEALVGQAQYEAGRIEDESDDAARLVRRDVVDAWLLRVTTEVDERLQRILDPTSR